MSDTLMVAIVGFLAAVVGGMVQAWAAKRFEVLRFERQNRNQAYLTYLKGISEISFAQGDDRATQAARSVVAEARGRIALTGSEAVIERMIAVFENGADLHSPKARADLSAMLVAMRQDSLGNCEVGVSDKLFVLMFGQGARKEVP